jgi:hypothetical protein
MPIITHMAWNICCSKAHSAQIVWDHCQSYDADDRVRHLPWLVYEPQLDERSSIARSWQRGAFSRSPSMHCCHTGSVRSVSEGLTTRGDRQLGLFVESDQVSILRSSNNNTKTWKFMHDFENSDFHRFSDMERPC